MAEPRDLEALGAEMHGLIAELLPILRSITGDGVRKTLAIASRYAPLTVQEVPTGTPAFDWTVPKEWNLREAWIKGPDGRKVVDLADSTLHVLSYSTPVHTRLARAALDAHLFSLPEQPELIPYRTSYYRETWGFCLPHRQREALPEGEYEVLIEGSLAPGSLTYGELFLPGASRGEVLLSCHICHPSLANDNLSGLAVALFAARELARRERRFSYRFAFVPGTIGSIVWLSRNHEAVARVRHGLVLANLGDAGPFTYKRSRRGAAEIDRLAARLLAERGLGERVRPFVPFGYDERQYCSPGFNLPVGLLSRTPWGEYPAYHTSADDLELVRPASLAGSLAFLLELLEALEANRRFENLNPFCEPQLGRRGLYAAIGGAGARERELALLWVLNQSDGTASLLDIAERSGLPFARLAEAAAALEEAELLRALSNEEPHP